MEIAVGSPQAQPALPRTVRLVPAILVALAASLGFIVVPVFIDLLRHGAAAFQPSESQVGLLGSADPGGMFAGAVAALWLVNRFDLRAIAIAALTGLLMCNLASIAAPSFEVLMSLRLAAGLFGGMALAVGLAQIGATSQPDRNGAIFFCLQTLVGSALAALSGSFGTSGGLLAVFSAMTAIGVVGLAACYVLTSRPPTRNEARIGGLTPRRMFRLRLWALLGNGLTAASFLIFWANIGAIGESHAIPASLTSLVISVGLIGGAAGSIFAITSAGRFRRSHVVTGMFACLATAVVLNLFQLPAWLFLFSAFLLQFGTCCTYYGFGALAQADDSGHLSIVHILTLKAGFAVGPAVASQIILLSGLQAIMITAAIAFVCAWVAYLQLLRDAEAVA